MKTRHKHKKNLKTKAKTKRKIKHKPGRYEVQSVSTGRWMSWPPNRHYVNGVLVTDKYVWNDIAEFQSDLVAATAASMPTELDYQYLTAPVVEYQGLYINNPEGRPYYLGLNNGYGYNQLAQAYNPDITNLFIDITSGYMYGYFNATALMGDNAGQVYAGKGAPLWYPFHLFEERTALCDDGSAAQYDQTTNKWWCPIETRNPA